MTAVPPPPAADRFTLPAGAATPLAQLLSDRIRREGAIPFAAFMQTALYHESLGYYRRGRATVGREGDFLTSPEVHPIFSYAIAAVIAEVWERMQRPTDFVVREIGPGTGAFVEHLWAWLHVHQPRPRRHVAGRADRRCGRGDGGDPGAAASTGRSHPVGSHPVGSHPLDRRGRKGGTDPRRGVCQRTAGRAARASPGVAENGLGGAPRGRRRSGPLLRRARSRERGGPAHAAGGGQTERRADRGGVPGAGAAGVDAGGVGADGAAAAVGLRLPARAVIRPLAPEGDADDVLPAHAGRGSLRARGRAGPHLPHRH